MNYYLKKRLQSGLTKTDMAKELGLDYLRYSAVEGGDVKMPTNLIEKFNEIINKGKENEIVKTENEIKADEFWKEVSQLKSDHVYVLHDKMKEFNISNLKELVNLLGYKSSGTIYNYLEGRNPVGSEFKKRLYNFFSDEKNIQIPTKKIESTRSKVKMAKEKVVDKELDKYFEETEFRKILKEHKITNAEIAKAIGVHCSTVADTTRKKYKPSYRILREIKNYLDSVLNDNNSVEYEIIEPTLEKAKSSNEYISKQKVLDECEKEIAENREKIEILQKQIIEINGKIELTTKVADLIRSM